jgi:peptidoglycan/xylan/chitin deacetylase (PgdA/CDA1 family)
MPSAYPGILRAENAAGMVLVNHTWAHVDLALLPAGSWPAEVDRTSSLRRGVTGHSVRCLRPPYGLSDPDVDAQLRVRGLAELGWDVDPSDYLRPGAAVIARRVLAGLHPGAIVILHHGGGNRAQTVAALPAIIGGIRAPGCRAPGRRTTRPGRRGRRWRRCGLRPRPGPPRSRRRSGQPG